ncbi:MAG: hypothetical protein L6R39_007855, partial [Caloplaca ligustica]
RGESCSYLTRAADQIDYSPPSLRTYPPDEPYADAASVLRQLSRATYCLQYLDLTDCAEWVPALTYTFGGDAVDWTSAWQAMRTVKVAQGWMPECLRREEDHDAWRELLMYNSTDDPAKKEQAGLLRRWIFWEVEIAKVAESVRWRQNQPPPDDVEAGRRKAKRWSFAERERRGGRWSDDDDEEMMDAIDPLDETYPANKENKGGPVRVVFDRGWEGWWIKECIAWYRQMLL